MHNEINDEKLYMTIFGACIASYAAQNAARHQLKANKQSIMEIKNAADTILEQQGLKSKGVKIRNITKIKDTNFANWPIFLNPETGYVKGKNAGYNTSTKEVLINMNKRPLSVFHELGHAYDCNYSKMKFLYKKAPLFKLLSLGIAVSPCFIDKTPAWEKENRLTAQKIKDDIRDNAPAIAVTSFLPVIAGEASASIRASQFAKPLLSKHLYNKMVKGNIFAFATYFLFGLSTGLIAKCAKDGA